MHVVTSVGEFLIVVDPNVDPAAADNFMKMMRANKYNEGQLVRVSKGAVDMIRITPAKGTKSPAAVKPRAGALKPGKLSVFIRGTEVIVLLAPALDPALVKDPQVHILGEADGMYFLKQLTPGDKVTVKQLRFLNM